MKKNLPERVGIIIEQFVKRTVYESGPQESARIFVVNVTAVNIPNSNPKSIVYSEGILNEPVHMVIIKITTVAAIFVTVTNLSLS